MPTPAATPMSVAPAGFSAQLPAHGLSAPLYLTAIAGNRSVELSWYPSYPAAKGKPIAGYLIFRGLEGAPLSPEPINVSEVAKTFYSDDEDNSDSAPLDRHNYLYRVRAYNADGLLSPYSVTVSARPDGPLLPPRRFRAVPGDSKVQLAWMPPLSTGDADLADYVLLRGPDGAHLKRYRVFAPDTLSFTDRGLNNGRTWYYAVAADAADHKRSSPTDAIRAVPYKFLGAPTGLSGVGLGEDIVRLTWNPPADGNSTFPLLGYDIYRSTGAPVDYGAAPLNRVLVTGTRFEDDSDNSVSPVAMGNMYSYTVVAVDSNGDLSAPSRRCKAGPVASITKLEAGTFDVLSGNTLQIQGRKTISVSDTWMLWRQNLGNTYGADPPSSFALTQQLQVQLSGQVGRKIKVDVDYDDSAAASQQQKISVVYGGDDQEVVKQFAFGDIQMDLDSSHTQFANYNKSLFGAQLKIASPDDRLRITAVGAQTQGFTETKT
ncbi:MAG: fibronectin type III domain-containing protein, partial [bacterium]